MTPARLELWLILAYVAAVLIASRAVDALARAHFARARRHDDQGFEYVPDHDHYRCAGGEHLPRHDFDPVSRRAIYRAPASTCNACPLKPSCCPHDAGRQISRSTAAWSETDVGLFHQRLSVLMAAAGGVISAAELWRSGGEAGSGLLLMALLACVWFAIPLRGWRRA
jgi:hypothetical protein